MHVLLVSTYELGHQPLHLASPAAVLRRAGHDVVCRDLSVQPWDPGMLDGVDAVAFSVPMHTAMRLARAAAAAVRRARPDLPICFYGLYATVSRDPLLADRVIAGEYETPLLAWVDELAAGGSPDAGGRPVVALGRVPFGTPARDGLPPLRRYAHLDVNGQRRQVGYTEASHGCAHTCGHCPVPVVYGGRVRLVDREAVLADVAQQVAAGAQHITFGDPDFLNGWRHALRIVETLHERFPHVTFDATVKVEHILRHADLWGRFAAAGCLFVVSALESVDDATLTRLEKGHTTADAAAAVDVLRRAGIEVRPSFLPFTPWTRIAHVVDLLDFVVAHDLVANVDPVQYTIRLLVPEGSLLLDHPDLRPHLGPYDAERLTYTWASPDPAVDELQATLARIVERAAAAGRPAGATFLEVNAEVRAAAGLTPPSLIPAGAVGGRPRLTEPWFC